MAVLNRIEEFRTAKGWSRPRLAKLAGTSTQQIERLEKGARRLSDVWLERLANALGVAPQDLISENELPSEAELQEMIDLALREIPRDATLGETTRIVAASLREQLERRRAGGEDRDTAD